MCFRSDDKFSEMSVKKVIVDGRSMTLQKSGIGRYILEMINAYVRKYGSENVLVIVNNAIELPCEYEVVSYNRHSILDTIRFSFFLLKKKYNIYHSGDLIGPFWHRHGVRHFVTCHDLMWFVVPDFFGINSIRKWLRLCRLYFYIKLVLMYTDVISVSRTTQQDLLCFFNKKSIVLREGVNRISTLKKESESSIIGGLENGSFFLYVGLGANHKNVEFMVNAFLESNTQKKMIIVGKGHKQIDNDRLLYLGYVNDSCLDYLYRNCAAFIFPSKYEGFGLPILEALSYHCKVFSSTGGALKEFSPEVVSFFSPNNKNQLKALIEKEDKIVVNSIKIDTYLKDYEWDTIWNEFFDYFLNEK